MTQRTPGSPPSRSPETAGEHSVLPLSRRLFYNLAGLAGLFALYCLVVGLVVPRLVKTVVETELSHEFQSACSIGSLTVNSLTLKAVARDVVIPYPPDMAAGDFLRLKRLEAGITPSSLGRGALVAANAVCEGLVLRLSRDKNGTFSLSRFMDDEPLFPFIVNALSLRNSSVQFRDDPLGITLKATNIALDLPFISSLDADKDIPLRPTISAILNDAPVSLTGTALPFASSPRAHLTLNAPAVSLADFHTHLKPYTSLAPQQGTLATEAVLDLAMDTEGSPALTLAGTAQVTDLILNGPEGTVLALPKASLALESLDIKARKAFVTTITLEAPKATIRRMADGSLDWQAFITLPATGAGNGQGRDASQTIPPTVVVKKATLTEGKLTWHDATAHPPVSHTVTDIALSFSDRGPGEEGVADVTASFGKPGGGLYATARGTATMVPPTIAARVTADNLALENLGDLFAKNLGLRPDKGTASFTGTLAVGLRPTPSLRLADGTLVLTGARMRTPTDTATPFLTLDRLEASSITADTTARSLRLGTLAGKGLALALTRGKNGSLLLPAPPPVPRTAAWKVALDTLALTGSRVALTDLSLGNASPLALRDIRLNGKHFATHGPTQWNATLTGRQGDRGTLTLSAKGTLTPLALTFSGKVDKADLRPLSPYIQAASRLALTEATLGADLSGFVKRMPGSVRGGEVSLRGTLGLYGVSLVQGTGELGGWGRLRLENLACHIPAAGGRKLTIGAATINAPRLFVTIDENGTNSLHTAFLSPGEGRTAQAAGSGQTAPPEPAPVADSLQVDSISITQGQATYRDMRLTPPYRLRVDGIAASLQNLSLDPGQESPLSASLNIDGAPVTVEGTLSGLFQTPAGKGEITVNGLDLKRLSRYAQKYLGYPVKSGELSADSTVSFKGKKLKMRNSVEIRDLELGSKTPSPYAPDLPLATAASILRDRSGAISLDLPVSGTIGDPEFRLGGVTASLIANLAVKTVTSPVTLLDSLVSGIGSLFGGDGPRDARIAFRPGADTLDRTARDTLRKLGKELKNWPGLTLVVMGVADAAEKDALIDAWLAIRLRTLKYNALPPAQKAATTPARVVVSPDHDAKEYTRLLFALYRDLPFVKSSKDPAVTSPASSRAVMRTLRKKIIVTESQLQALATARGKAVRNALTGGDAALASRITLRQGSVLDSTATDEHMATYAHITVRR